MEAIRAKRDVAIGPGTIKRLLSKGWIIEASGTPREYQVTDKGIEAIKRKMPL